MSANKRILAMILAIVMVLGMSVPAAANTVGPGVGGETVIGDGTVVYLPMDVIYVILPTDIALDFFLDPQGLLAAALDGSEDFLLSELEGGTIIPRSREGEAMIINNSQLPVEVNVNLTGTIGVGGIFVEHTNDLVANVESVTLGTSNVVLLYVTPSTVNVVGSSFVASSTGFVLGTSAVDIDFVFDQAEYLITLGGSAGDPIADRVLGASTTLVANSGSGTALEIGGFVNPDATWGGFLGSGDVSLEAVFDVRNVTEAGNVLPRVAARAQAEELATGPIFALGTSLATAPVVEVGGPAGITTVTFAASSPTAAAAAAAQQTVTVSRASFEELRLRLGGSTDILSPVVTRNGNPLAQAQWSIYGPAPRLFTMYQLGTTDTQVVLISNSGLSMFWQVTVNVVP